LPSPLKALQNALVSNREKLVEILNRTQESEDMRHKKLVDMEKERK